VAKAVAFYRKALAVEPAHAETARRLGHAWMLLGNMPQARAAFAKSLIAALTAKDAWGEMAAHVGLGDVSQVTTARRLVERLAAGDPSNTVWQRDLSVSYNKLGDVADRQGKTADRFVRNGEARRPPLLRYYVGPADRGLDLDRCQLWCPEDAGELLHNLLHVPGLWRLTRGIISNFFDSTR
jgi:tetratricopeptide (TPR) repeat protein